MNKREWHSVREWLPASDVPVLACTLEGDFYIACFIKGKNKWFNDRHYKRMLKICDIEANGFLDFLILEHEKNQIIGELNPIENVEYWQPLPKMTTEFNYEEDE